MIKHEKDNVDCICDDCCERRAREHELEREGLDAASRITNYVNSQSNPNYFVAGMARQHRSLQQFFTRLCVAWFEHLAKLTGDGYDLRNEASARLARAIVSTKEWEDNKYLPRL